jgi:hypothetical protein
MSISRRDFLKLSALGLGGLAVDRLGPIYTPWPPEEFKTRHMKGRVAGKLLYVYDRPSFLRAQRVDTLRRDQLIDLLEEVDSPFGPSYNPRWYRLGQGYVHSGRIQRVELAHLNPEAAWVPESGQLGEITVPFVQCLRRLYSGEWEPLYRLYYSSIHWVTSVDEGPDGKTWYGLKDELLRIAYHVPAACVRLVQADELTPVSPYVPAEQKRIEVSLAEQTLTAYEGDQVVLYTQVSTGIPNNQSSDEDDDTPTDTPDGVFHVQVKVPSKHMGDGNMTDDLEAYELPGVPWVSFFHKTGVAFHGTYWHDNFGRKMSHGCVNMRNEEAKWLYRWTVPTAGAWDWTTKGYGTVVKVISDEDE